MKSRRSFLKSATGLSIGFCSCGLLDAARAQTPNKPWHLPVTVNGKRVRTIDTHSHCYFQDAIDLMGEDAKHVLPPVKGVPEHFIGAADKTMLKKRLADMDAMGIDMEVLSINPFWYRKDRDTADAICKLNNKHFAELCAAYPKRFSAFASLTMQFPDLAVQQLEAAMKMPGIRGAAIGGSVNGEEFANEKYHPVLAKAEELGAVLFIHPQSTPELAKRLKGNGWLSNVTGNPLDTTLALEHLIFEGVLDKFPKLKILAAHGGGFLGSYAPRMDRSCYVSPQNCNPQIVLKKKPTEYLGQIYYDSLIFTPEALRHLVAEVGSSQVVLGTDHPIPWEQHPVDLVFATKSLTNAQRVAILGGNAERLLGVHL